MPNPMKLDFDEEKKVLTVTTDYVVRRFRVGETYGPRDKRGSAAQLVDLRLDDVIGEDALVMVMSGKDQGKKRVMETLALARRYEGEIVEDKRPHAGFVFSEAEGKRRPLVSELVLLAKEQLAEQRETNRLLRVMAKAWNVEEKSIQPAAGVNGVK